MANISVIIPCYNCEGTIDKCLDSLAKQTYRDYEIIAVNDGSTDRTLLKLSQKKEVMKKLIIIDTSNGGVSNARNVGLEKSSSPFITFVDSDDYVTEHYLENLMLHRDKDLVVTGYISGRNNGSMGGKSLYTKLFYDKSQYLVEALHAGVFGFVWGKLYCRKIILQNNVRMNIKWANYEDEDFNLHYLTHCKTIQSINCCDYFYFEPEHGKPYKKTDYVQQAIEFLGIVKKMKNYQNHKDFINTWLLDRFLLGVLYNKRFRFNGLKIESLNIFKNDLLPYISKCKMVKIEKRKKAILLFLLLFGNPCILRIRFAFTIISKL